MGKNKIPRHIYPQKQVGAMKALYPQFRSVVRGDKVEFRGKIRVKPEFSEYSIRIVYEGGYKPKVYVEMPVLLPNTPHVYPGGYLCLYHPKYFRWTADKLIAKEIMQWTIAWLYFYECWKDTGVWYGPEVAHGEPKDDTKIQNE